MNFKTLDNRSNIRLLLISFLAILFKSYFDETFRGNLTSPRRIRTYILYNSPLFSANFSVYIHIKLSSVAKWVERKVGGSNLSRVK